jgi:hypothetical protein
MKAKTFLPLFTGFYGSTFEDVNFDGESEYYSIPDDKELWEYVDWQKYYIAIAKKICNAVENLLSDWVSNIEFEELISPKFYNYSNDSINCEITFDRQKVTDYLIKNYSEFERYLKENYSSRDGFISHYSTEPLDWADYHEDKHKLGAVLQFICENEGFEEPTYFEDIHISEFYKDEINEFSNY